MRQLPVAKQDCRWLAIAEAVLLRRWAEVLIASVQALDRRAAWLRERATANVRSPDASHRSPSMHFHKRLETNGATPEDSSCRCASNALMRSSHDPRPSICDLRRSDHWEPVVVSRYNARATSSPLSPTNRRNVAPILGFTSSTLYLPSRASKR